MEKANYLKESPGVGTYMGNNIVTHSRIGQSAKYNFSKKDRGLLKAGKQTTPGPDLYNNDSIITKHKEARFKIGAATRDIPFSKYGALHSELVSKGLH